MASFDCLIYAFDPLNLARGPLYVLNPLSPNAQDTISTDHLSVTSAGTLVFTGWDDNDGEYSVWAVPGVSAHSMSPSPLPSPPPSATTSMTLTSTRTGTSTSTPSPTPTPSPKVVVGLSAGAGAGITLAVLAVVGGGAFYAFKMGALKSLTDKLMGSSYGAFGSNAGLSKPSFGSAYSKVAQSSVTSSSASVFKATSYQSV